MDVGRVLYCGCGNQCAQSISHSVSVLLLFLDTENNDNNSFKQQTIALNNFH